MGAYREGRDGGGEVLDDGGRSGEVGLRIERRHSWAGLGAVRSSAAAERSRAVTVRSRAAQEAVAVRLGGLGRRR